MSEGVSRTEAEEILINFLNDENLKVLLIKGKWGVGKTHLVKNVLKECSKKQSYYGSMFGISSLEQLKGQILVNANQPQLEPHINKSDIRKGWYQKNIRNINRLFNLLLSWIRDKSPEVSKIPKIDDISLLGSIKIPLSGALISIGGDLLLNYLFSAAKNSIICIDDLERKSSRFELDELLGFVDYLVRKLESKVILVCDEDRLIKEEGSKKSLDDYREKVVDLEILLEPTSEENINLVFGNDSDIVVIQQVLKEAGAKNIRIFRKILWILNEIRPLMRGWHHNVYIQTIRNVVFLVLAKFDTNFPLKLQDIVSHNTSLSSESFFSQIGYQYLDIDTEIVRIIQTASFNKEEFTRLGKVLSEREEQKHTVEKFRKIWESYYSSFRRNEMDIKHRITEFLETNYLNLSLNDFEKIKKLASFVELDISHYEIPLLKYVIATEKDIVVLKSLKTKFANSPELVNFLEEKISSWDAQQSITNVLGGLVNRNGWSTIEAEYLNNRTVDDYYDWLQEENNDLPDLVRTCLDMRLLASDNLKAAIIKLAKENKLNSMRANLLYSIDINDKNL